MQKKETQQFAKFFLKDIKNKSEKDVVDKSNLAGLNFSSAD